MTQNCLIEQNNQIEEEKYEKNSRFLLAFKICSVLLQRSYYSEIERENTSFTTTVIKNSKLKRGETERPTPKFVTLTHLSFQ